MSLAFNIDASAIRAAEAAQLGEGTPHFGNITIPGQMQQTSLIFPDGLHLLLFSPNARNMSIEKRDQPSAPVGIVTPVDSAATSLGSGFWTAIYNYSWSIKFQEQNVNDVVATIEVPYDRNTLESLSVRYDDAFLGRFDSTRGGWVVDTSRASVDSTQNKTRIIGSPNLDGEYMLVGRKSSNSHGTFIQLGSSGESSDFQIEEPPANLQEQCDPSEAPVQVGTWIDGFQLEVRSCKGIRVNMNFFNASEVKIQQGFKAVSPYGYMLNSSDADTKVAVVAKLPLRSSQTEAGSLENSRLRVAQLDPASGEFRIAYNPESNTTSTSLRILSRALEIEASSLDIKWLLIAPELPLSVTSNASLTATAIATPISAVEDCHQVLATNAPSPSPPGSENYIVSPTAPASAVPVVTLSTEEGVEKVMKIEKPPIQVLAVDRSILKDQHIAFVLDSLPAQTEARIDQESVKSYVGIDLFYGKDHNVKGLVFVTRSHALVVRIPDNAAHTSAARYEKKLLETPEDKPKLTPRTKGRKPTRTAPERTYHERLRELLDLNLVAFGMAQISLTLWDTLRERVDGINLSTATSKPAAPPARAIPDPNAPAKDNETDKSNGGEDRGQGRGGRGGRGGHRSRGGRGDRGNGRGRGGRNNGDGSKDHKSGSEKKIKTIPIELPEDKEDCWDRPILSPGEVVQKIDNKVSRMDINAVFVGQEKESDMMERVAEAISRGWVGYIIANHEELNLRIQDAPIIKPSRLTDEELTFFSKSMVAAWIVMGEGETDRPIEREDMKAGRKNEIVSQSHKKRIRASKHQEIQVRFKDGQHKTLYAKRVTGNAKAVKLTENELTSEEETPKNDYRAENNASKGKKNGHRQHVFKDLVGGADEFNTGPLGEEEAEAIEQALFDMENVDSFKIFGRAQSTMAEQARDLFILRLLEGRGSLRGPEYQNCEFIRRVWFPTPGQLTRGKQREEANAKKSGQVQEKARYDWVEDSWGDDTDEEDAARALKSKVPESELIDYDTEDSDIGSDFKARIVEKLVPKLKGKINESQEKVIGRVTAPNPKGRTRATLVHGPPGTGKTSTITGAAIRLVESEEYVWIVAQSNVGIGNVAGKLLDIEFTDFVLIVSEEYYVWSEEQYKALNPYIVRTTRIKSLVKRFKGKRLVLCTLAALSNPMVEDLVMYQHVPLQHLIIDEASQIDMTSQFMHLFFKHRYALKNICWFGDPKQLPPYGWSEAVKINDIFQVAHLQANSKLMDTSYRLPVPIAKFISKNVYNGQLKESPFHKVKKPTDAILFIDTPKGMEEGEVGGTSSLNRVEAELVVQIAELYYNKIDGETGELYEFDIITPYDAQRRLVEGMLKARGINKEVYNVDSFQGREADYIITTLTKTTFSSFLTSVNRLNVLLTRCKKGLVVVTQKEFVRRTGGLLLRLWWEYENDDIWKDAKHVLKGYVDLPGSPAPNERPEGEKSEEEGSDSE